MECSLSFHRWHSKTGFCEKKQLEEPAKPVNL